MTMPANSRTADKFVVRLPDGMREQISEVAKESNRSMNSEIITRLEYSLAGEAPPVATRVEPWTPAIGMLIVYKVDTEQTQPMEILKFGYDRDTLSSKVTVWFQVRMPSGAKNEPVYANLCRPYIVK